MTRKRTSSNFASFASARRARRIFWFVSHETKRYGPLPTGWRPASAALGAGRHAAAETIGSAKAIIRPAFGFEKRNRMVTGSGVSIDTRSSNPPPQVTEATLGSGDGLSVE